MASGIAEPRLIIICGLPGAGKTTLAKSLEENLDAVRLCPDEMRIDAQRLRLCSGRSRSVCSRWE